MLCISYYRLSSARWYRYGILCTAFLCVACFGSGWLAAMLACRPVAAAWDLRLLYTGGGHCPPPPAAHYLLLTHVSNRVVDSNLIVFCGCLRAFVLHVTSKLDRTDESQGSDRNSNNSNRNRNHRGSGIISSSDQRSHKLRTFGADSTRRVFDTIAEIEFGDCFHPANYYHHQALTSRTATAAAAAGLGTFVETGNDITCFAGDAASTSENGSEVQVLMRYMSTRMVML